MMNIVVIDPLIIMTPSDDATQEEVDSWFTNLYTWLNEALTAPFTWLHYLQAFYLMQEHGRFPDFSKLKRLQRQYHLDINISQIARHINELFRNEELDLANYIDRLNFIIEPAPNSILVQPSQFITRLPNYIQDDFYLLLANCSACQQIALPLGTKLHIATFMPPDNSKSITVSTVIQATEPESICNIGETITQTFPLIITPDDLPVLNDIVDIWGQGANSIVYTLQQLIKKETTTHGKPFAFRLGPRFIESVNERGLDTNEIVLRSIMRAAVNVLLDNAKNIKGYSLHDLRINEAPDSPRRERASDKAQAWRLKLQQSGAGWRLHYWQIPTPEGPLIEFANIAKESESEIY
jgi:hypothetical protein